MPVTKSKVKTMRSPHVSSMLVHRLRRWPNIDPTMGQCSVIDIVFDTTGSILRESYIYMALPGGGGYNE